MTNRDLFKHYALCALFGLIAWHKTGSVIFGLACFAGLSAAITITRERFQRH